MFCKKNRRRCAEAFRRTSAEPGGPTTLYHQAIARSDLARWGEMEAQWAALRESDLAAEPWLDVLGPADAGPGEDSLQGLVDLGVQRRRQQMAPTSPVALELGALAERLGPFTP